METPEKTKKAGRKKLLALALIALVAAGGLAAVSVAGASSPIALPFISQGTTQSNGSNLEIVVWTYVNGSKVPVQGAEVTVYTASYATGTNGTITITLTPIANGTTNSHGAVYFDLANGRYVVIAHHDGMRGACLLDLRFLTTKFIRLNAPAGN